MVLGCEYSQVRKHYLEQVSSDLASICHDHDSNDIGGRKRHYHMCHYNLSLSVMQHVVYHSLKDIKANMAFQVGMLSMSSTVYLFQS